MNLAHAFVESAAEHADRIALRTATGATTTYAELDDRSARAAGLLVEAGIVPGDRVAVMLPNVPEFAITYFGALRVGAVVVPMNPLLKAREIAHYLGNSGAKLIFVFPGAAYEFRSGAPASSRVGVADQVPQAGEVVVECAEAGLDLVERNGVLGPGAQADARCAGHQGAGVVGGCTVGGEETLVGVISV